jgi:hypothetical protein
MTTASVHFFNKFAPIISNNFPWRCIAAGRGLDYCPHRMFGFRVQGSGSKEGRNVEQATSNIQRRSEGCVRCSIKADQEQALHPRRIHRAGEGDILDISG